MNDIRNRCHRPSNRSFDNASGMSWLTSAFQATFMMRILILLTPGVMTGVGAFTLTAIALQGTAIASSLSLSSSLPSSDPWHPALESAPESEQPPTAWQTGHRQASSVPESGGSENSGGSSQTVPTTVLVVNPLTGNDATGDGSQRSPFRTLTHALERATAGTTIMLTPGTYSAETGERFPIRLKPGVTVYGNPDTQGDGILIQGGGGFVSLTAARQNITILGADQATLAGVTVTNPNTRGYGVWVESSSPAILDNTLTGNLHDGVSVNGTSAPLIQRNRFVQNGANGVTVFGRSQPRIQNNVFEETGYGINLGDSAAPIIVENRIVNNRSGVVAQEQSRPVLRNNIIENNQQNGVVAIAQAQPDLGTVSDPGNNQFSGNGDHAINAQVADFPVIAAGNQIDPTRVLGTVDFDAQQSSSVPVTTTPVTTAPVTTAPVTTAPASLPMATIAPVSTDQSAPRMPLPSLLEQTVEQPSGQPSGQNAEENAEGFPDTPLSAENATELIPVRVSPPPTSTDAPPTTDETTSTDALIPAEPLSRANATELPVQRLSGMDSDMNSDDEAAAPSHTLPAVFVPATMEPADPSADSPDASAEVPLESSSSSSPANPTLQASVRMVRSPATPTTAFPRPTALNPSAPTRPGQDALPIDQFIVPESRSSQPSEGLSGDRSNQPDVNPPAPATLSPLSTTAQASPTTQATPSEADLEDSTIPAIRVTEPNASSRPPQRIIRPAARRPSPEQPESSPSDEATTLPLSASVSAPIPIQVIDPPASTPPAQPQAQALLVNPVALSRPTTPPTTSGSSASASPEQETPRLINPAANQLVNPAANAATSQAMAIAPQRLAIQRNENLLPVPSADVPEGHVGDRTRISVGENPLATRLGITNSRASLRYRVVVDGQAQNVDAVRAVSPGAFHTWLNGRSLIQVGAFASLENATDVAQLLANQGIQAEIQPMQ